MVHRHFSRLLADDWPTVSFGNCSSLLPALTKHKWLLIWSTHDSMCLLTVLFNLLYKVEKNLLTLSLLLETVDSQFNCDHWQIFLLRILSSHELRFFMALFFSPDKWHAKSWKIVTYVRNNFAAWNMSVIVVYKDISNECCWGVTYSRTPVTRTPLTRTTPLTQTESQFPCIWTNFSVIFTQITWTPITRKPR